MPNIFGYPKYREQKYVPSPWSQEVWDQLTQLLSGNRLQRGIEQGAARGLGRAQTEGYRQAVGQFSSDPALLASVIARLQGQVGQGYTEAAERGAVAQAGQRREALGGMQSIASLRDQIEMAIKEINLRQRQRQEEYLQDLWSGLLSGLGGAGKGYMQMKGTGEAAQILAAG